MTVTLLLIFVALGVTLLIILTLRNGGGAGTLNSRLDLLERNLERLDRLLRDELARSREESLQQARQGRDELAKTLLASSDAVQKGLAEGAATQRRHLELFAGQLKNVADLTIQRLDKMNETVEQKLRQLQEDNSQKLEQMRATVDEKLHATLEQRLGESFKLVSDRLEQVHKGLGEMQSLASGVTDLKRVLTNVKTRGILGEIQLQALLEQILTPEQYEINVATRPGSSGRVEFAIRMPGRGTGDKPVLLPIDAKFPLDDYQRLLEAQERGDLAQVLELTKLLRQTVLTMARTISDKYLEPPHTTDFAIMYLPTEGLYAEILRMGDLFTQLQRDQRVVVTGPSTLAAFLNSLQMGFRTLAIEQRSSEVWALLAAVKTEFNSFGTILDKTRKKLQEASNTIDSASVRSRAIARKLRDVEALPAPASSKLLDLGEDFPADGDDDESIE
ncbi:MAG TPA: DNA recombination protein RmuC [Geobacterales bacterium]|nr:DNA recombination protein RmuC [Geobacterales bacterium]